MDKNTPHHKQLEYLLTEIVNMHKKIKGSKDCTISQNEMDWYIDLLQKVKKGNFSDSELIYPITVIPDEIKEQLKQIEQIDFMKFVEGIDTESLAYRFYNSQSLFRVQYNVSIFPATDPYQQTKMNLQSMWAQKAPWSDQTMNYYLNKY